MRIRYVKMLSLFATGLVRSLCWHSWSWSIWRASTMSIGSGSFDLAFSPLSQTSAITFSGGQGIRLFTSLQPSSQVYGLQPISLLDLPWWPSFLGSLHCPSCRFSLLLHSLLRRRCGTQICRSRGQPSHTPKELQCTHLLGPSITKSVTRFSNRSNFTLQRSCWLSSFHYLNPLL